MFFIKEPSWSSMNLNEQYKEFPSLLFFLINNPKCEKELQYKLENFQNNNQQIPLFLIFLRIFSSQSNLKIDYKKETLIYNIISKELEIQIHRYIKEKQIIKNMDWIGLLTNIESKFINPKMKKIYNYFKTLCSFELNNYGIKIILEKIFQNFISVILPKIFLGEVDKLFEEDIFDEKSIILYFTNFIEKFKLELEDAQKEKENIYLNKLNNCFKSLIDLFEKPNIKELYQNFVDSIKDDIKEEKEENKKKIFNSKIEKLKNDITFLREYQKEYTNCYNILIKGRNNFIEFHKHIKYLIEIEEKLKQNESFEQKTKKTKYNLYYYSIQIISKELSSELIVLPVNFTIKLEKESYIYIPFNGIESSNIKINIKETSIPVKIHIEKKKLKNWMNINLKNILN